MFCAAIPGRADAEAAAAVHSAARALLAAAHRPPLPAVRPAPQTPARKPPELKKSGLVRWRQVRGGGRRDRLPVQPGDCGDAEPAAAQAARRAPALRLRLTMRGLLFRVVSWQIEHCCATSCGICARCLRHPQLLGGHPDYLLRARSLSTYPTFDHFSFSSGFSPHLFAVPSVLAPRFRKPAPRPRKTVRNGRKKTR